jgi:hypothetical protein
MNKYLAEGSVEEAVSLYYIVVHGFDVTRQYIILKFGFLSSLTLM